MSELKGREKKSTCVKHAGKNITARCFSTIQREPFAIPSLSTPESPINHLEPPIEMLERVDQENLYLALLRWFRSVGYLPKNGEGGKKRKLRAEIRYYKIPLMLRVIKISPQRAGGKSMCGGRTSYINILFLGLEQFQCEESLISSAFALKTKKQPTSSFEAHFFSSAAHWSRRWKSAAGAAFSGQ